MLQSEATDETVANVSALVDAAAREIHAGLVRIHAGKVEQPMTPVQTENSLPVLYATATGAPVSSDKI
jgi:hypothetical protein